MSLIKLILYLLVAIFIGGCSPVESSRSEAGSQQVNNGSQIVNNNEIPDTANDFKTTKYNGKWISNNYQIVQMDGYTAHFGSELHLEHKNNRVFWMNMYDISPPPASRIASIESEIKITSEGRGNFSFDSDGWGSCGSGTIELYYDQVIVTVDSRIEQGDNPDWRVYSGKRVFLRENILPGSE